MILTKYFQKIFGFSKIASPHFRLDEGFSFNGVIERAKVYFKITDMIEGIRACIRAEVRNVAPEAIKIPF